MNMNFKKDLLDLNGVPLKDGGNVLEIGRVLADTLCRQSKGDAMKLYDWGRKLYKGEPLNLDRSDRKVLREVIENSDTLTVLAKAQMFEIIDEPGNEAGN